MKKLELTAIRDDREKLLQMLLALGCVEIAEPDELFSDEEAAAVFSHETSELERLKTEQTSLLLALDTLRRYVPVKSAMFAARRDIDAADFYNEADLGVHLELAGKIERIDNRIHRADAEETRENALIESLLPWEPLDLPLEHEGTRTAAVLLGTVPPTTDFFALERAVSDAAPVAQAAKISENKDALYICVIYLREAANALGDALREFSFSASAPKNMRGTAGENIADSRKRLTELTNERVKLTEVIVAAAEYRDELQTSAELLTTKIARAEAQEKFAATVSSVTLTGWVPVPSADKLEAELSGFDCAYELTDPTEDEYANVPVQLNNNALTRPLSMVTEMYSLPAYSGVDPNPLMTPFFILFYGFMMADMGYGLVMIIAALFVKSKKPRAGGMKDLFELMFLCGISTFIFGVLTGGIFGDAPMQIAGIFGKTFTLPYTPPIDPVNGAMNVLIAAFALGGLHIIVGMVTDMVHKIRSGHVLDGLADNIPWWTVFAGIAVGALGHGWIVMIVGLVLVDLAGGRSKKGIFGKLFGGIGKLYDITAYFGDVLSYSRLMALMLAGGVIANVFNQIAALTGNIFTFTLIFLIGHALNLGLNLLGCYVHDLRLQCLEFFGKFYEDGGRPFKPLSVNSKYINVIKK
ncbi:MAG: V-type ATP synthase subunit I [Oscillospiraceae bacterium]|jgi:V/A-type H+-transporting ATPase subunit I|nr:V-type ATP synthase subunit I [Oscillospiraceae bacterium]